MQEAVEKSRELILDTLRYVWSHPETGYREEKTSRYMEEVFEKLGYEITRAGDIPGFYTVIDTGRPGPEILVLGELDALLCQNHREADPLTGAAHVCGHCAQCAALVGVAAALREEAILNTLCGRIRLCAVPAEELLELEYRNSLREKGIIHFFGGKPEFMRRGYFETCDIALMVHTTPAEHFCVNIGGVGCRVKNVVYKGRSAHAGGSPWQGINALYAATQGLNAVNAIRETFREPDIIRVHPIITQGGSAVNAIPERVTVESYVRGSSFAAIDEANTRVNRALCGAALSLGANVDIRDMPGYAPYKNDPGMIAVAKEALSLAAPEEEFIETGVISSGSTDMGDLSLVMPMIHPYAPGAVGTSHGDNYYIEDPERACIASAKWQLAMLYLLLKEEGTRAADVIRGFTPAFATQKEYIAYLESLYAEGDRIEYKEGTATVRLS